MYPPYFTEKSHSKLSSHLVRKEDGGWEFCPVTLLKLPQNWVICIEKRGRNNFAQVTTVLGILYWKHCLFIKNVNEIHEIEVLLGSNLNFTIRVFTWGQSKHDNMYKKYSVQFDQ